ncbi:hypothetical protein PHAVU_007G073700 [Phaseolus vulgaris]|uniref:Uncharacterized protein n=1 Tax=Phaseolus vulgaris TaxID=3885 RepID=V7BC90_PHAVU|nr:hypothetical protein PHAVU_007G073700g [Phaseolus vulgaris]ESW15454.1 hypothetical protein PHAVU_007G073700g [Phaseolus vulgaris]
MQNLHSAKHRRHVNIPIASYRLDISHQKINLISCGPLAHISDIKLIRTDTTLDLSQKAEKGMIWNALQLVKVNFAAFVYDVLFKNL